MTGMGFDDIKHVIDTIAKDNDFKNHRVQVKKQDFDGGNYCSDITNLQIVDGYDLNKKINLFIKFNNVPEKDRKIFAVEKLFKHEIDAYNIVLPALRKYQQDNNIPKEKLFRFPKFYEASHEYMKEYAIMEDLVSSGYSLYGKIEPLDYKHCSIILNTLADFHAISFAITAKDPIKLLKLVNIVEPDFDYPNFFSKMLTNVIFGVTEQMESRNKRNAINKFVTTYKHGLHQCLDNKLTHPYNVICHGDIWNTNLMYKNEGDKTHLMIVDYQFIRYVSPVTDIVYMFYMSGSKAFRDKYFNQLCDEYYEALKSNLVLYDCNIDDIYPRDIFDRHLKDLLPLGIWFGLLSSLVMFVRPGEEKMLGELMDETAPIDIAVTDAMLRRLENIADDIISKELLDS